MPWWWGFVTFAFGSGGAFTIIWFVFTRRINKADQKKAADKAAAAEEAKKRAEYHRREYLLLEEYRHAMGRYTFWHTKHLLAIEKQIDFHPYNGELHEAQQALENAEKEMKHFKNEQVADLHTD